jgi:hypothetical protein
MSKKETSDGVKVYKVNVHGFIINHNFHASGELVSKADFDAEISKRDLELRKANAALASEKGKVKKAKNFLLDVLSYDQNCDCGADTGNETQVETCYFHQLLEIVSKQSELTPNGDLKERE